MKIWIVSSDPFLDDFEKIADCWPSSDEIYITTLTKYGLRIHSFFAFLKEYIKVNPTVILTDHGYFGFQIITYYNKLKRQQNPRLIFFLRGNYWLEERIRSGR